MFSSPDTQRSALYLYQLQNWSCVVVLCIALWHTLGRKPTIVPILVTVHQGEAFQFSITGSWFNSNAQICSLVWKRSASWIMLLYIH